ncbi:arsenate reductase ArsC [bacterium]|nr:arsenate reductase ArsC [bacterium]
MQPRRALFLCTGNSCRSQMAEAWLRRLGGDRFQAFSAGAKPAGTVHPFAVRVMAEAGVDIARHRSKSIAEFAGQPLDLLVTVCDHAREACPHFAGADRQVHWGFDDPAGAIGTADEQLTVFRRVRNEIRVRIESFLEHGA